MHALGIILLKARGVKTPEDVLAFLCQSQGELKISDGHVSTPPPPKPWRGAERHAAIVRRALGADYFTIGGRWSGLIASARLKLEDPKAHARLEEFHRETAKTLKHPPFMGEKEHAKIGAKLHGFIVRERIGIDPDIYLRSAWGASHLDDVAPYSPELAQSLTSRFQEHPEEHVFQYSSCKMTPIPSPSFHDLLGGGYQWIAQIDYHS
jgi:hypothetical protein